VASGCNASFLGAFPLGAALADFREDFFAFNELASVGLSGANSDFPAQFGDSRSSSRW
jgi:hypothetical protein